MSLRSLLERGSRAGADAKFPTVPEVPDVPDEGAGAAKSVGVLRHGRRRVRKKVAQMARCSPKLGGVSLRRLAATPEAREMHLETIHLAGRQPRVTELITFMLLLGARHMNRNE